MAFATLCAIRNAWERKEIKIEKKMQNKEEKAIAIKFSKEIYIHLFLQNLIIINNKIKFVL